MLHVIIICNWPKRCNFNSAYGAIANEWFRWFDFNLAEAITLSGQLSIRWIEKEVNAYLNKILKTKNVDYVIASDTDSIYVNMEPIVKSMGIVDDPLAATFALDEFCKTHIQSVINKSYKKLSDYMNAYEQKMFMKRETIAEKGIWRGKKMYILNAWNIEGVQFSEPKLKIMGIEAVRSSTPKVCRNSIKKALEIIMNKDEESIQNFIQNFKETFEKLPFEDIASPRGMNGIEKYFTNGITAMQEQIELYGAQYISRTPIHVKGAIIYNSLLVANGLDKKYQKIGNGDKIKFAYLKQPNPIQASVISIPEELPPELKLEKYIDKEMQFEKTFLLPIKSILDVIGWKSDKSQHYASLERFYE